MFEILTVFKQEVKQFRMNGLKVTCLFILGVEQLWIVWFTCNKIGFKNHTKKLS